MFYDRTTILWMWSVVAVTVLASLFFPRIPRIGKVLPPSLSGILVALLFERVIVSALEAETC